MAWRSASWGSLAIFNPFTFDWGDRGAVAGNALLLLAAMLWAASIVHNRGHAWRSTPFQLAPWQALLAAVLLTLAAVSIEGVPLVSWNGRSIALLLFAGIPGTALAYWAAAVSSSELPASTTSLGLLGTPAVSVGVALLLLGEAPTFPLVLALALLIGGIAVGASGPRRQPVRSRPRRGGATPLTLSGVSGSTRPAPPRRRRTRRW